jgi:predicted DNA-binding transcriptional regulator AlpA
VMIRRASPGRAMPKTNSNSDRTDGVVWRTMASAPSSTSVMKTRQAAKIAELRQALIAQGFVSLSQQAAALGLSRSTTWHLLKGNHKSSGLSATVVRRMLKSPQIPPDAKLIIEDYVQEKLAGAYGHKKSRVRVFRAQLGQIDDMPIIG